MWNVKCDILIQNTTQRKYYDECLNCTKCQFIWKKKKNNKTKKCIYLSMYLRISHNLQNDAFEWMGK